MNKIVQSTLIALGVLPFSVLADAIDLEPFRQSRLILEFEQIQLGGEADALIPVHGTADNFFYTNLIASQFGNTYQTFSAGLGHRQIINNAIYGYYAYYDRQKSKANLHYNRISGGAERLGMTWDMRANFYVYPGNNSHTVENTTAFVEGNGIYYNQAFSTYKVGSGGDFEIGRTLGLDDLRGYAGGYFFTQDIQGPRVRATYNLTPRWQFSGLVQYDEARGWLGMTGISYTLGRIDTTHTILDRIREPVVRDLTVAETSVDNYNAVTKDSRSIYFANPNDPNSLDTALADSKPGDFIYLEGGDYDLNSAINLQANQTLWGSSADLYVNNLLLIPASGTSTLNANNLANLTTPNCGTYICAIYATSASTYGGFTLTNSGPNTSTLSFAGLGVINTSNVNISNLNINNFTFGLYANNATIQSAQTINASNNTSTGIFLNNNTSLLNASNIIISNNGVNVAAPNGGYGLYVSNGSIVEGDSFTITGNGPNTPQRGSQLTVASRSNVALSNSSIESTNGSTAVYAQQSSTVTIVNPIKLIGTVQLQNPTSNITVTIDDINQVPNIASAYPYGLSCNIANGISNPCTPF